MQNHLKILLATSALGSLCLLIVNFTATGRGGAQAGANDSGKVKQQPSVITFELTPELRSTLENEFQSRRERVEYACSNVENENETVLERAVQKMVIDLKDKLTWCPVYKAASSMWMKNFAVLSGFSVAESSRSNRSDFDFGAIVRQKYPNIETLEELLKYISRTTKFIIVRHPFERLLSAYRDKLEHMQGREFYYKRYGQYITEKYRSKQSNLTSLEPTFTEFLQFIADEKRFDEHWVPFFDSCQPCSIDYDYILKFESLSDEYNFFILEHNLQYYLNYTSTERINTSSQGITNDTIAKKYFQEVSASLLLNIFKIYELDFLSFSYSPTKYYYMTSDANNDSNNLMK